jgi:hypothetical protein
MLTMAPDDLKSLNTSEENSATLKQNIRTVHDGARLTAVLSDQVKQYGALHRTTYVASPQGGGKYEDGGHLGCCTVQPSTSSPTFQR